MCDGSSKTCPAERTAVAQGTVCRPAVDQCDLAEECDGEALGCPADRSVVVLLRVAMQLTHVVCV